MKKLLDKRAFIFPLLNLMSTFKGKAAFSFLLPPFSVGETHKGKSLLTRGENSALTLLHSEWPKLYGVLAILSAIGL